MVKWRGIAFRVHPLFVLIMLGSIVTGRFLELTTLFLIVLVHELGHVAAALKFGWRIREVKLLPFGGVVEVEDAAAMPVREEMGVALAGPLQNAWLAGFGWLFGMLGLVDAEWAAFFVQANGWLALFNLLPILPLDGGKIVQAWASLHWPYHRTLVWCATISIVLGAVVVVASLYPLLQGKPLHLNLLMIGLFLCYDNWMQRRNVPYLFFRFLVHRFRSAQRHLDAGALARPIVLAETRPIAAALRLFMKEGYHLIYIMRKGRIVKVVPEAVVIEGVMGQLSDGHADFRFFM